MKVADTRYGKIHYIVTEDNKPMYSASDIEKFLDCDETVFEHVLAQDKLIIQFNNKIDVFVTNSGVLNIIHHCFPTTVSNEFETWFNSFDKSLSSSIDKNDIYFEKCQIILDVFTSDSLPWLKSYLTRLNVLEEIIIALNENNEEDEDKTTCEVKSTLHNKCDIDLNKRITSYLNRGIKAEESFPDDLLSYVDLKTEFTSVLQALTVLCLQKNIDIGTILCKYKCKENTS